MTVQRYLQNRQSWEVLIAAAFLRVSLFANVGEVQIEFARSGAEWDRWLPWVLELTSHVGMAVVIPIVVWFDHRFPIRSDTWRTSALAHVLFSVVASAIHVVIMYGGRVLLFRYFSPGNPCSFTWVDHQKMNPLIKRKAYCLKEVPPLYISEIEQLTYKLIFRLNIYCVLVCTGVY